jgi:protein-disulfide isomerase
MSPLVVPVGPRDHVLGSADAPVTLIEYGDFECPHCGSAYPIVKEIQQRMGPDLRFVFRHFPLTQIHSHAEHAAESTEAAAQHGKFWQMHDILFENQERLEDPSLVEYAEALGIDPEWFALMLTESRFQPRVREQFLSGVKSGVNGTPTFFVNGVRYDGPATLLGETLAEAVLTRG